MAGFHVTITDTTGAEQRRAELPHDVPMRRLMPALLTALNRPILGQNGEPISYRLYHNGMEIGQEQTLEQSGVRDGATLTLSQEATAGAGT